jgi:hypothetical protein
MKVWVKAGSEGKFLVVRRDGTVQKWPHFVLGARDPYVAHTLRFYASLCGDNLLDGREYADSLLELADDFDLYRAEDLDGDPLAGPHRTDDAAIILAMRHELPVAVNLWDDPDKHK